MVQVHIYYETLDTEITEEKPAYDLNDFGCKYCQLGGSCTNKNITTERHWLTRNEISIIPKTDN